MTHTYRVEVLLIAEIEASTRETAKHDVLHELQLRCAECKLQHVETQEVEAT